MGGVVRRFMEFFVWRLRSVNLMALCKLLSEFMVVFYEVFYGLEFFLGIVKSG